MTLDYFEIYFNEPEYKQVAAIVTAEMSAKFDSGDNIILKVEINLVNPPENPVVKNNVQKITKFDNFATKVMSHFFFIYD